MPCNPLLVNLKPLVTTKQMLHEIRFVFMISRGIEVNYFP